MLTCRLGAVGNGQTVAAAVIPDGEAAGVGPKRTSTCHKHRVVRGIRAAANIAGEACRAPAIGDDKAVGTASVCEPDIEARGVCPHRIAPGHKNRVVGGIVCKADVAEGICHPGAVGDGQRVAAAGQPDVEMAIVGPHRVCPGHQHCVVRGICFTADIAIRICHAPAVGDGQRIAAAAIPDVESAGVCPNRIGPGDRDCIAGRWDR